MPPGTRHAVFTVCGMTSEPEFAIMEGAFFDRHSSFTATTNAAVQSLVWNTQWSNTDLYTERAISLMYILAHHVMLGNSLLSQENLFAALALGKLMDVIFPTAKLRVGKLARRLIVRDVLEPHVFQMIRSLPDDVRSQFATFEEDLLRNLVDEHCKSI